MHLSHPVNWICSKKKKKKSSGKVAASGYEIKAVEDGEKENKIGNEKC